MFSAAAAAGPKVAVVCFIFSPVMKNAVPITTRKSKELYTTLLNGQNPTNSAHPFITATIAATFADVPRNVQQVIGCRITYAAPFSLFFFDAQYDFSDSRKKYITVNRIITYMFDSEKHVKNET